MNCMAGSVLPREGRREGLALGGSPPLPSQVRLSGRRLASPHFSVEDTKARGRGEAVGSEHCEIISPFLKHPGPLSLHGGCSPQQQRG